MQFRPVPCSRLLQKREQGADMFRFRRINVKESMSERGCGVTLSGFLTKGDKNLQKAPEAAVI